MSSKQSTVDYILDQLSESGNVRVRKMFGEYALYCDEKVVGLICEGDRFGHVCSLHLSVGSVLFCLGEWLIRISTCCAERQTKHQKSLEESTSTVLERVQHGL